MISTIIVGNGLGMALDNDHFCLKRATEAAAKKLSKEKKEQELIKLYWDDIPSTEEELEDHQRIAVACRKFIAQEEKSKFKWLGEDGHRFPDVYLEFTYQVSFVE